MKRFALILSMLLLSLYFIGILSQAKAADPILVLQAEEAELGGNANISGVKVGNIGLNGGTVEGTVTFRDLALPADGTYTLLLHYYSGSDDRTFDMITDMGDFHLDCPNTGSFDTVGTIFMDIDLKKGGFLTIGSQWYGPDLDKIEIYEPGAFDFKDKTYENADNITFGNETKLILDKQNGVYSLKKDGNTILSNAHAETKIDGQIIASDDFVSHTASEKDGTVTFTHTAHPSFAGTMTQTFILKGEYVLTKITVSADKTLETNYISPLSAYSSCLSVENGVFLQIPFDNDAWVEPKFIAIDDIGHTVKGYEVGAFYNENTTSGIIFGSVEHDIWKTGIHIHGKDGDLMGLSVFGGASDGGTRDAEPHGAILGKEISSPLTFIGCYDDWRIGMTAYGKANAEVVPPKESVTDVPFGYNSWGSLQSSVSYSDMIAVSNYIKENLQDVWGQDDAAVYVNIDSFWDYLAQNDPNTDMTLDQALAAFVAACHENGQKAGIYYTPFATWLNSENDLKNNKMEGSNYTYYDAALRKADGSLYGKLDGGWALDATHPATLARIENRLQYFIDLGFSYVKLDFMTHGALEGEHFDKSVQTGIQAYNFAMAKIHEICNGKMFVNLSIAPIFPYQYADGRRISCDAFASLDNTQHVLSYLSACFWEKELYTYPDPDHLVVWGSAEGVARARVTSGVISGTSFLVGDDLSDITPGSGKAEFIFQMFGNKDIVSVAKMGKAFLPLSMDAGDRCANTYYCIDGDYLYIAIFNFDYNDSKIALDTFAMSGSRNYVANELWSGKEVDLDHECVLHYTVPAQDAALFKIHMLDDGGEGGVETDPLPGGDITNPPEDDKDGDNKSHEKQSDTPWALIIIGIAALGVIAGVAVALISHKKK